MDEKERTPLYRVEEGVAWLTLNRPETLNSFTTEFVHEINDAIRAAEEDDKVRALVVTGEGRGFTSGGNLSELAAMNRDRRRAIYDVDSTADMVRLLYNVKKPVIAAINGPAFGAGTGRSSASPSRVWASVPTAAPAGSSRSGSATTRPVRSSSRPKRWARKSSRRSVSSTRSCRTSSSFPPRPRPPAGSQRALRWR